jgi:ABC-type glycerol-3-phosphate transport system substrate-binding protein
MALEKTHTAFSLALLIIASVGFASAFGAAKKDTGPLRIMWWGSQTCHDRTLAVLDMFTKKTGIKFEPEFYGFDDYIAKLNILIASGDAPDIMQMGGNFTTYINHIQFLNKYIKSGKINTKNADKSFIGITTLEGKIVGLSSGTNAPAIAYDPELFKKAGATLPTFKWTWNEWEKAVMTIRKKLGIFGCGLTREDEFHALITAVSQYNKKEIKTGRLGQNIQSSQMFCISKASGHKNAAARFLNFFANNVAANRILKGERGVPIMRHIRKVLAANLTEPEKVIYGYLTKLGKEAETTIQLDSPIQIQIRNTSAVIFLPRLSLSVFSSLPFCLCFIRYIFLLPITGLQRLRCLTWSCRPDITVLVFQSVFCLYDDAVYSGSSKRTGRGGDYRRMFQVFGIAFCKTKNLSNLCPENISSHNKLNYENFFVFIMRILGN